MAGIAGGNAQAEIEGVGYGPTPFFLHGITARRKSTARGRRGDEFMEGAGSAPQERSAKEKMK